MNPTNSVVYIRNCLVARNGRYSLRETRAQKFFLIYIHGETHTHACLALDTIKLLSDENFILEAHRYFAQRSSHLRCYYLHFYI